MKANSLNKQRETVCRQREREGWGKQKPLLQLCLSSLRFSHTTPVVYMVKVAKLTMKYFKTVAPWCQTEADKSQAHSNSLAKRKTVIEAIQKLIENITFVDFFRSFWVLAVTHKHSFRCNSASVSHVVYGPHSGQRTVNCGSLSWLFHHCLIM